jgi:transposase InsO family protein
VASAPNQVWTWDITYMASAIRGQFFFMYLIVDIYSRKVVGFEVHERESMDFAAALISYAALAEGVEPGDLVLHSDNGGPMKGATMLATLQKLGIAPSFSRPHTSDDNPFSESLFRTMKLRPEYPDGPFATLEEARAWAASFVAWYNNEHLHSAIRFVTPAQRHRGESAILEQRRRVYELARARHPERWSGQIRNWTPVGAVVLNPDPVTRRAETRA